MTFPIEKQVALFATELEPLLKDQDDPAKVQVVERMKAALAAASAQGDSDVVLQILRSAREALELCESLPSPELLHLLASQYTARLQTLSYFHIPHKITGIDGKEYNVPTLEKIHAKLTPEKIAQISKLRNPKMLLCPIALSTVTLVDALDNEKNNSNKKTDPYEGVSISDELRKDKEGSLIYSPKSYTPPEKNPDGTIKQRKDGGKTKLELLQNNETSFPGWDVVFIDGDSDCPPETTSKDAHTLLKEFTEQGFSGTTVDDELLLQMDGIQGGTPYNQPRSEYLLGNYVPLGYFQPGYVPYSGWTSPYGSPDVFVNMAVPDYSDSVLGARRAIRI